MREHILNSWPQFTETKEQIFSSWRRLEQILNLWLSRICIFLRNEEKQLTLQWNINDKSKFPKFQKSIFILFLRITSANMVVGSILWEVWSPVSHSSSHYHPPDTYMCGIISKLFPFPSPPATNLLPSSPLTTREMSSHCCLSQGKDWPWRQVPLLNADYTKSFSSTHASRNPFFHLWWFYISAAAIQQHRTLRLQSNLLWGSINTSLSH